MNTNLDYALQVLKIAGQCKGMMADLSNNEGHGYCISYQPRVEHGKPIKSCTVIFLDRATAESDLVNAIAELSGILAAQ